MKRILMILLCLSLLLSAIPVSAAELPEEKPATKGSYPIPSYGAQGVWDKHAKGVPLVVAHKGDWRNFPENSLLGINSCINMGVDIIEVDFNVTKDGVPVLLHDTNLRRMTDADTLVYIADITWAQAKKYSLEDGQGNKGSNYILTTADAKVLNSIPTYVSTVGSAKSGGTMPIARFDSVLELVNKRIFLLMDKITTPDIFAYAYVCAREWDMLDYVIFKNNYTVDVMETWYSAAAALWNKKYPTNTTTASEVKTGITYEYNSTNLTAIQSHIDSGVHVAFISVGITDSNEARIRDTVIPFCRKNGIAVRSNTGEGLGDTAKTDSEIGWAEVLKIGVTEIMTDHPGELITYLQQIYGTRAAADRIEGEHFSDYNQDDFGFTVPLEYSGTRNKSVKNLTSKDTLIYEKILFDGTENTFTAKASASNGTITAYLDGTDPTNKIGTLTVTGSEYTAPQIKISNIQPGEHTVYLKFTGTVILDHIRFGRGLYFDFSTQAPLVYRYRDGPYSMTNYSTGNWFSRTATMGTVKLDNGAGTLSATLTAGGNHYIQTGTAASSRPLHYIPQQGDYLQIRMKISNAVANDVGSNMYAGVVFSGTGCGDFDYSERVVQQITASQLNDQYFTLTMPMNNAFTKATEITALRLYFMNLISASGKTATITVDHVYIGPKAHLPQQDYLYFNFTDTDADQMRYNTDLYSYQNFDHRQWIARTATMHGAWFSQDESALTARVTTGGNHYIQSGATINERSLHYKPSGNDYLQIVLRIDNGALHDPKLPLSVGISYAGTEKEAFFYDAKLLQDFPASVIGNGYFTVTVPMPDYFAAEANVQAFRLYIRNLAPKNGEAILTVDSIYLGPKETLPKPLYSVEFVNHDGTVLEAKQVAKGDTVSYTGTTPIKVYDGTFHYTFSGWDKALSNISANTKIAAQYTATAHTYTYHSVNSAEHKATCSCGHTAFSSHNWSDGQITTDPQCTTQGTKTYTCTLCYSVKTEAIKPTGHSYHRITTPPTCTTDGYTTYTCSVCGNTYTAEQTPSTGHSYSYTPSQEKHVASCHCGDTFTEAHSFTEGLCICGQAEVKEPVLESSWKLGHSLNLASDISVNYGIARSTLAGYDMDSVYILAEIDSYKDGKYSVKEVKLLPVVNGSYYYFTLTGLTAVNMNDEIRAVLYGTKDGQVHYSPIDTYSVATYAYAQIPKASASQKLKVLCAELLRYGAKAQIFKGYRTDTLADANMTEEQKALLSDMEAVTFGNMNLTENIPATNAVQWLGKSLDLASKVSVKFIFSMGSYTGSTEDLTMKVTYKDINDKDKEKIITDLELYNASRGYYAFTLDSLLAAELRSVLTVQILSGDTVVSGTLQYAADTYGNGKTDALGDLCKALFAYSDSAKAYFIG